MELWVTKRETQYLPWKKPEKDSARLKLPPTELGTYYLYFETPDKVIIYGKRNESAKVIWSRKRFPFRQG